MTDRELLELAAKAVNGGAWHPLTNDTPNGVWNPLTDDGDAFRLAVQCKIDVKHYDGYVVAWFDAFFGTGRIAHDGDPCAATRRAIVRAVAELGKQGGDK